MTAPDTGWQMPEGWCDGFGHLAGRMFCPGCPSCGVDPRIDQRREDRA